MADHIKINLSVTFKHLPTNWKTVKYKESEWYKASLLIFKYTQDLLNINLSVPHKWEMPMEALYSQNTMKQFTWFVPCQ